ncbi:MAG: SemiSWEET family transporter [Candidatus Paceibacterota bacterium]|jgi:uncharacterized protein with PQ loop repeat
MSSEILGVIATITSLVFMGMGLPVQIYKIHEAKSTQGISLFTQLTLFLTTMSWCVYAFKISNLYILTANAPGAMFALVILYQFWVYRHHASISVQGITVTEGERDHIKLYGEMWLTRRMIFPPSKGERIQAACGKDTIVVSVAESTAIGKPHDGIYRMKVEK